MPRLSGIWAFAAGARIVLAIGARPAAGHLT
jgi:hypothetical protein